jgi:hypothetical protein
MQTVPLNQMADTTPDHLAGADAKAGVANGEWRVVYDDGAQPADDSPSGWWRITSGPHAFAARTLEQAEWLCGLLRRAPCPYCDDTGLVHRADGEFLGGCTCPAGARDDGQCRSCVNGKCVTGPECVSTSNPAADVGVVQPQQDEATGVSQ